MFVVGLGVPQGVIERQLAIAQHVTTGTSTEEKELYAASLDEGSYRGYKLRGIWKKDGGVPDNIEVRTCAFFQRNFHCADFYLSSEALQP